ncbi:DUF6385 domain-containing protein [Fonticella tunisiensis]|uniref:DUF6385 domain-containing protein n=1 Tax=Fonticella tunisiensis TaxID=1096341 RepID=A0A4R7KPH7_9CLOT|nr:DUF6385 domain-containing protein [Fonticella tunisiensis]TDT61021.1 hypothetical protein EDD71_10925 [Fonticella tunisiensis]
MPNNLVFNDVASQLKVLVYGLNGANLQSLSLDANGAVSVSANNFSIRSLSVSTDTVSVSANSFDIRPLTVSTDTVSVSANSFDIRPLTVSTDTVSVSANNFSIRSLSVSTDTVSVSANNFNIRSLTQGTDTVGTISSGAVFTSASAVITSTGTGIAFTIDNSQDVIYSFYVRNTGAGAVSVKLQIAPVNTEDYFVDDSTETLVAASTGKVTLATVKYLRYTRLYFDTGSTAGSFEVFYNAHR